MITRFIRWLLGYQKYKISYSLVYPDGYTSHAELETYATSPEDAEGLITLSHYANGNWTNEVDPDLVINTVTLLNE